MGNIKQSTRRRARARVALDGPSGAGKTKSMLRALFALKKFMEEREKRPIKVGVIDTERGSASLYHGQAPDGIPFEFGVIELAQFPPTAYVDAIKEFERAGYDLLGIDSLSHAWEGVGGALDIVNQSKERNEWARWKDVTPMHRAMVDAILQSPMHVWVTMRSAVEYVLEKDQNTGKNVPKKVGVQPKQRPGMEYEFTLYGSLEQDTHILTLSKTRCDAMHGRTAPKPGADYWLPFFEWLYEGDAAPSLPMISAPVIQAVLDQPGPKAAPVEMVHREEAPGEFVSEPATLQQSMAEAAPEVMRVKDSTVATLGQLISDLKQPMATVNKEVKKRYGAQTIVDLTEQQATEMIARLQQVKAARAK